MTKARDLSKLLSTANGKIAGANLDVSFENISDTGTAGTKVASGTTAQRGSTAGQIRFNTTTGLAEYYTGSEFKIIDSPPTVITVSPLLVDSTAGGNITFTITGSNFNSGAVTKFIGNDATEITASTTTVNSGSSISAVIARSSFVNAKEPYDVKVINGSGLSGILDNQINVDTAPSWSTASGQIGGTVYENENIQTTTVSATDADGETVSYSVTSNALPSGLSINSANGQITGRENSGTISSNTTYSYNLGATANGATTNRAFTTVILDDPSLAYSSNLKVWFRGGYNGRTASTLGSSFTGSSLGVGTGYASIGTTQVVNDTSTGSPINASSSKWIRDSLEGNTKTLQDDKLAIYSNANSTWWWTPTSAIFGANMNHTFIYWMKWDNVSAVTSGDIFNPTFHSWSGTNATAYCANDWYTNGTSNPYMSNYVNGPQYGTWNMSTVSGGTNGNKGVWFHVALVYSSGQTLCYLNGNLDATLSAPTSNWTPAGSNQVCSMNSRGDGYSGSQPNNSTNGYGVPKYLADVRYYNTNISQSAVQAIYNKSRVFID
jgi:hypothetical protein